MKSKTQITKGIIGKKVGMTQIFDDKGNVIPVTVVEVGPCTVAQVKTLETDGYEAIQLGFQDMKEKHITKPQAGHFKTTGGSVKKYLKEFRIVDSASHSVGEQITVDTFAAGDKVDVTGVTKGHGYTGAVKRWGTKIKRMTHGGGPIHRNLGSVGANSTPSRIYKNKKMAGQYGNEQVTVLNLAVVKIDSENNLIAIKGAIPGAKGGIVFVRDSVKA